MSSQRTTVLMPWDGEHEEWLHEALHSLPNGTPFVVAQNSGKLEMASALNDCLARIDTEYTFVMGADDLAAPGMLELLEECVGDADGAYPLVQGFGAREFTFEPPLWCRHIVQHRNICGVFLVRTEVLKAVGGWRDAVIEDWDLINRIAKAGYRFERVLDAEYLYRQHPTSLTHRIGAAADAEEFSGEEQLKEILGDKLYRYPLRAVFYNSATAAQNYVRALLPAEYLPGIVTRSVSENNFGSDVSIWLHPGTGALEWGFGKYASPIQIADVDDAYCADQMIPEMRWLGRHAVANQWMIEQPAHNEYVRRCDAVFCATPHLAEVYAELNENVFVLRNSVLEADWRRVRKPEESGKVRIGWAAGSQHAPDASLVAEALRRVKRRHANVEVVLVGNFEPAWDFEYTKHPFTPSLAVYRQVMSTFDISLGPIRPHVMGRGKSDLKWLDSSMAGAAFIGSVCEPYETVKHGKTGLLCDSEDEWETAIETLVTDQDYRLGMAKAARKLILKSRTAQHESRRYRKAIQQVRQRAGVEVAA